MRILYIFSGNRSDKLKGKIGIDYPDTPFYGLNHLNRTGVTASYKEINDFIPSKILGYLFGFRGKHLPSYFLANKFDILFGASVLYTLIFKKIFNSFLHLNVGPKKIVLFNLSINRLIHSTKTRFGIGLLNWLLIETDRIVCLSYFQKQFLDNHIPNLKNKTIVVQLGVDVDYYSKISSSSIEENIILSVGRDNGRDYKTVVNAAKLLPNEKFVIVCSRRNIKDITEIPTNVSVYYDLSSNEVRNLYTQTKILLLITHDDNFQDGSDCSGQTVLLDSMASGLPIIASQKQYIKEYIKDKEEALLVNFYDEVDLVNKIVDLNNNVILRSKLRSNAKARANKDFTTKKMADNLLKVFEDTLKNEN
jgi:glycosyltransferase involved in cell wall biosynthesis